MSLENEIQIPIKCDNCGHVTERTLAQFQREPTINCRCGTVINIDTKEAAATMSEIQRKLDDLSRRFR
ncbi:MAG TPA: hypothetical protein VGI10_05045 [Polyangiaceae bacterium]|jgi:uncharacterized Zn finger protein